MRQSRAEIRRRIGMTLIELLVVMAIIGILMAVLVPAVSKMREHGYSAQCANNLRNLANAAINYANDNDGWLPRAQPREVRNPLSGTYEERAAWVNWVIVEGDRLQDRGPWQEGRGRDFSRPPWPSDESQIKALGDDLKMPVWWGERARRSIREGQLWPYLNRDIQTYLCPQFYKDVHGNSPGVPMRSYVMNAWFYFEWDKRETPPERKIMDRNLLSLQSKQNKDASRLLLFADMQPEKIVDGHFVCTHAFFGPDDSDRDIDESKNEFLFDGKLDYEERDDPAKRGDLPVESIGILHRGRANVVFVDGHVESLNVLKEADSRGKRMFGHREEYSMTYRLCEGEEVYQHNYEEF